MKFPVILIIALLLAGCGGGAQHWYKAGQTQVDFDQDGQECEIIAKEFARQATLTGNREDPESYVRTYNNCLFAKGWSVLPSDTPADSAAGAPAPMAACQEGGIIQGFGKTFAVPPGFVLSSDVTQAYGPTMMQNLLFQGPEQSFINFTFQKAVTRDFKPADYPVREPFFLYEQGAWKKNRDRLRWAVFSGNIQGSWVAGLGGYLIVNKRQRISIVVTSPLPSQTEAILSGLRLDSGQIGAVEKLRSEWLPWLESHAHGM
jgi:hypothetical protein